MRDGLEVSKQSGLNMAVVVVTRTEKSFATASFARVKINEVLPPPPTREMILGGLRSRASISFIFPPFDKAVHRLLGYQCPGKYRDL